MEDRDIIRLYWNRDAAALTATAEKYGSRCTGIAQNILGNPEDAEECVNDAYWNLWNTIPPQKPRHLGAFLARAVRNLALDRYRHDRAEKRGGGQLALLLDELEECVSGGEDTEERCAGAELLRAINAFLGQLPRDQRTVFLRRYWYCDPVRAIAADAGMSPGSVTMALKRIREKLRIYLIERGFEP